VRESQHNELSLKGTEERITAILTNIHIIRSIRYSRSDYTASNVLMDYTTALEAVHLTDKQANALDYRYEKDLTQKEVSTLMGCTQQAVQQHIKAAVKKIAIAYRGNTEGGVHNE